MRYYLVQVMMIIWSMLRKEDWQVNNNSKDAWEGLVGEEDDFFELDPNVDLGDVYSSASSSDEKEGQVIDENKTSKERDSNIMIMRRWN